MLFYTSQVIPYEGFDFTFYFSPLNIFLIEM